MAKNSAKGAVLRVVTREAVFRLANELVAEGQIPTQAVIRQQLGGSNLTIHKYLKEWKQVCFQAYQQPAASLDPIGPKKWATEKRKFEAIIKTQLEQNEKLASELLDAELETASFDAKFKNLQQELTQLRAEALAREAEYQAVQAALATLKEERHEMVQQLLADKNQQIESLREELKALNQESQKAAREAGYQADEVLINERVININLKEKVNGLEKTVVDLQQKLLQTQLTHQRQKSFG